MSVEAMTVIGLVGVVFMHTLTVLAVFGFVNWVTRKDDDDDR